MIAIVVLAFSGIALTVVSEGGILNPPHIPLTDLQENINLGDDTIQIFHIGGEAIDLSAINIILSANGKRTEFNSSEFKVKNLDGSNSTDDVLMIGDCIVINTTGKEVNLMGGDAIDMFIVHTPSEQVIQKTVLQTDSEELPEWITPYPYGSVYSNSTNGGWQDMELVGAADDGLFTNIQVPKKAWVYEEYEFGVKAYRMDTSNPLKLVQLKIIYGLHDDNSKIQTLSIYNGSAWTQLTPVPECHDFDECNNNTLFDITPYVKTTDELEKLQVMFSVKGNSNNEKKYLNVDFIGIHVES